MLGQVVADAHLGAHDAVGLGVAAALRGAGAIGPSDVPAEAVDDGVEAVLLVGREALLGELQALVRAPAVDQILQEAGQRLAERPVEGRAEERLEAALGVQPELEPAMQGPQHRLPAAERRGRKGGTGIGALDGAPAM